MNSRVSKSEESWTIFPHVTGLAVLIACLTYPAFVDTSKTFGGLTVRISDPFIAMAFVAALTRRDAIRTLWPGYALIAIGLLGAAFNSFSELDFFLDLQGPILLFAGFAIFSSIRSKTEYGIILQYLAITLWVSASVELLIYSGILTSNYALRASFAGEVADTSGLGRLITPTHILAVVMLGVALALLFSRETSLKQVAPVVVPASIIVALAGTRLSFAFILITLVGVTVGSQKLSRFREVAKRLFSATGLSIALIAIASLFWENAKTIWEFASNIALRTLALAPATNGTTDASTLYREFEFNQGIGQFLANPFFGLGFGARYLPRLVNDDSWLGLFGPVYSHNLYLWLLVKTGTLGLAMFILFFTMNIKGRLTRTNRMQRVLLIATLALVPVGIVWNLMVNIPDSLIFGGVLGLFVSSKNWGDQVFIDPHNEEESIKE